MTGREREAVSGDFSHTVSKVGGRRKGKRGLLLTALCPRPKGERGGGGSGVGTPGLPVRGGCGGDPIGPAPPLNGIPGIEGGPHRGVRYCTAVGGTLSLCIRISMDT